MEPSTSGCPPVTNDQTRHMGKVRCDHAYVTSHEDKKSVVMCGLRKTTYPLYPTTRVLAMVRECQRCDHLTVSCVECGSDITARARVNGKVYYCRECKPAVRGS